MQDLGRSMNTAFHVANALSILLFLGYGLACLFADGMETEFQRFGLSRFRRLTGWLEVAGALGLCAGLIVPVFTIVSAAGLAWLMLLGVFVRVRVRDSLLETMPAAVLLLVNLFIGAYAAGWRPGTR
jgi:hypothetical protein